MAHILIIDDDPLIREMLKDFIDELGHQPIAAATLAHGLDMADSDAFDLVFLDVNLPDGNGLDALPLIKNTNSKPEVIIITAQGNTESAKIALDYNAWDYIIKPFSNKDIQLIVKRSLGYRASKNTFKSSSENILERPQIIGSSTKLMSCLNKVARCAKKDTNILIAGPTGSGKELFANVIHANSKQKENRFVVVDCASLPEQLVEAVLFGHVKGAYTSADSTKEGLIIKADGGTLFLDEIGELPLSIQKKFLRVLQERKFIPVGGTTEIESNFRLISATNRNLEEMVNQNQFRKDLFFRLKTIQIALPSLKECKEDIKDLTLHYIYTLCKRHGFGNKGFVPEFLNNLECYDWPGNTRELISSLERAILADPESSILYQPRSECNPSNLPLRKNKMGGVFKIAAILKVLLKDQMVQV